MTAAYDYLCDRCRRNKVLTFENLPPKVGNMLVICKSCSAFCSVVMIDKTPQEHESDNKLREL